MAIKNLYQFTGLYPDIIHIEIHPYYSKKMLIEYCQEHNIIVEARSPFAHGDVLDEWMKNPILNSIAFFHYASIPQVILRWITQQGIIALPRTSKIKHLKENIDSLKFDLTDDEIININSLNIDKSLGFISLK